MLVPQWSYLTEFYQKNKQFKERQKQQFDRHHGARNLPDISEDTEVWITSEERVIPERVISPAETPKSYIVQTPSGELQRNRSQLTVVPEQPSSEARAEQQSKIPHPREGS